MLKHIGLEANNSQAVFFFVRFYTFQMSCRVNKDLRLQCFVIKVGAQLFLLNCPKKSPQDICFAHVHSFS